MSSWKFHVKNKVVGSCLALAQTRVTHSSQSAGRRENINNKYQISPVEGTVGFSDPDGKSRKNSCAHSIILIRTKPNLYYITLHYS